MPIVSGSEEPGATASMGAIIAHCYKAKNPSRRMSMLMKEPLQRDVAFNRNKHGKFRTVNWERRVNCEAALIQATGDLVRNPCERCSDGPQGVVFIGCVASAVDGSGSCGNCYYNGLASICTLRENQGHKTPEVEDAQEEEDPDDAPVARRSGRSRKKRKALLDDEDLDLSDNNGRKSQGPKPQPALPVQSQHAQPPTPSPVPALQPLPPAKTSTPLTVPPAVLAGMTYHSKRAAARFEREAADALERSADQSVPPAAANGAGAGGGPFPHTVPAEMSAREKRALARCHRELANDFDRSADEDMAGVDG